METISCHRTRVLIRLEQKHNYSFPPPIDAICEIRKESASRLQLQRRSRLKMLTDGWTDDGCLPILYTERML